MLWLVERSVCKSCSSQLLHTPFQVYSRPTFILFFSTVSLICIRTLAFVIVYKCLQGSAPLYLVSELSWVLDIEARQQLLVLPGLHHWSSAAHNYTQSGTEPFQLLLLVSGTVYPQWPSTSLLHLCCKSRLIFLLFPVLVPDHVQCLPSDFVLGTLIIHVTYLHLLHASLVCFLLCHFSFCLL